MAAMMGPMLQRLREGRDRKKAEQGGDAPEQASVRSVANTFAERRTARRGAASRSFLGG